MKEFYIVRSFVFDNDTFSTLEQAKEHVDRIREKYEGGFVGNDGGCRIYKVTPVEY